MKQLLFILLGCMYIAGVYGQEMAPDENTGLPAESHGYMGELVRYERDGVDGTSHYEYIDVRRTLEGGISCDLEYRKDEQEDAREPEDPEDEMYRYMYRNRITWTFNLGTLRTRNGVTTGKISRPSICDTSSWEYIGGDDDGGTYTFSIWQQMVTLEFTHQVYQDKSQYVISWKLPDSDVLGRKYRAHTGQYPAEERLQRGEAETVYDEVEFQQDGVIHIASYAVGVVGDKKLKDSKSYDRYSYTCRSGQYTIRDADTYRSFCISRGKILGFKRIYRQSGTYYYRRVWLEEITE